MIEYKVPKELDNIIAESRALKELRNLYAAFPFGYKKAARAARESEILERTFWQKVGEIYPAILSGYWTYNPHAMLVCSKEKEPKP